MREFNKLMKGFVVTGILIASCSTAQKTTKQPNRDAEKAQSIKNIDSRYIYYKEKALQIWRFAEVGFQEVKSSALLQEILKESGFTIQTGVAGMLFLCNIYSGYQYF